MFSSYTVRLEKFVANFTLQLAILTIPTTT